MVKKQTEQAGKQGEQALLKQKENTFPAPRCFLMDVESDRRQTLTLTLKETALN